MKRTIFISTVLSGLFCLFSLSGCVKEDQSEYCEKITLNSLKVYYDYATHSRAMGYETAEILHLFVFDEQGYLLDTPYEDFSPRVGDSNYYTELNLEPGNYHFVVWGNLTGCYYVTPEVLIPGNTHYDDVIIHLERDENNRITSDPHNLYFGDYLSKTITGKGEERVDITLKRNTYRINVYIDDRDNVIPDDIHLNLIITDKNGSYRFNNSIMDTDDLADLYYYTSFATGQAYKFESSLSMVRLAYENSTMFRLYNAGTGELIYEDNLIELIRSAEIDLDGEFEFDIVLRVYGGRIYVMINGWDVTHDDNQIIFG